MTNKSILIIGATSSLIKALAVLFAKQKNNLVLSGRNIDEVERIAADLKIRYDCQTRACGFEATQYDQHEQFLNLAIEQFGNIDGVVIGIGELGDQLLAQNNFSEAMKIINSNYVGPTSILNHVANYFEQQNEGFIVAVGSVAGDRGRQSNYIYGSAKAAFATYVSGLRNRLAKSNVHILLVKPGFMDTKMTFGRIKKSLLVTSPEKAAKDIYTALNNGKLTAYIPWYWQIIMAIIKSIPESIFIRMKL
jgi:short-subunit dehydrogenase